MDNDTKKFLSDLLAELQRIDYVRPEDIPNIDYIWIRLPHLWIPS